MEKKRYLLSLVFLIIYLSGVNAQPELGSFEESKVIIAPPPTPEEEESKEYSASLELREYKTKNLISDIHIEIELYNEETSEKVKTLKYVNEGGILNLGLDEGVWRIKLKVDKLNTTGKDYFFEKELNVDKSINEIIYLLPVGSLRGVIYDDDMVLKGALVKFDCSGDYGEKDEIKTNIFGAFTSYWLPVGSCKLSAVYGNRVGYKNIVVEHSKLTDVEVTLTKGVFSDYSLIYVIIVLIIVLVGYFYISKKRVKSKKEIKEITKEVNHRTKDIMSTLNEKEKKIVELLLGNNNKSTQSNIRYGADIPKTTLARLLQGLELKRVIKIEKIGKLKKVELTGWFLGKG